MVLVAHELFEVQRRGVLEELVRFTEQEGFWVYTSGFPGRFLGQHGVLGRFEHSVQSAQHCERENDFAVVGWPVVATQQVGDGPDKRGKIGVRVSHYKECIGRELPFGQRMSLGYEVK